MQTTSVTKSTDKVIRRRICRLCDGNKLEVVLHLTPTPLADAYIPREQLAETQEVYPLDLYQCHDCGFSQLLDVVQPQAIYFDYLYETKSSLGLVDHFKGYAAGTLQSLNPPEGSLVVDIGSNDGSLLSFFKSSGMRVLGVDPAREIAHRATEGGIETWPTLFDTQLAGKIRAERGPARIVTANNLFANVDDLHDMAEGIRALLAADGAFVFESFYLADLMQNMVFDFIYHEHISYFSVAPLMAFFKRHGMELIDAQRVKTKGGSLRYTVQLAGGPRKVSPKLGELISMEEERGIGRPASFKEFNARIEASKREVVDLLRKLRAQGETIAGFGASATTTTLIYHYGITDMLDFIADDNPQRQNLFSPGKHIPVLSPKSLQDKKPDYLVILAWRYVEPIMQNLESYRKQGGKFIVPLPELIVL
ncbi:MAG: class I SAM-dependent methyltransferase [Elusimicrobia bacterium]|nr:class I SAM-dependent methyltransferase [Elusimicrobiota bacterium]